MIKKNWDVPKMIMFEMIAFLIRKVSVCKSSVEKINLSFMATILYKDDDNFA